MDDINKNILGTGSASDADNPLTPDDKVTLKDLIVNEHDLTNDLTQWRDLQGKYATKTRVWPRSYHKYARNEVLKKLYPELIIEYVYNMEDVRRAINNSPDTVVECKVGCDIHVPPIMRETGERYVPVEIPKGYKLYFDMHGYDIDAFDFLFEINGTLIVLDTTAGKSELINYEDLERDIDYEAIPNSVMFAITGEGEEYSLDDIMIDLMNDREFINAENGINNTLNYKPVININDLNNWEIINNRYLNKRP